MDREQRLVLESIVSQFPEEESEGIPLEQIRLVRLSEEQVKVVRGWLNSNRGYLRGSTFTVPAGYAMPPNGAPIFTTVDRPRQEFTVYGDGSGVMGTLPPYHFELPPNMFETNPIMQGSDVPRGLDDGPGISMREAELWQSEQEKADDLAALEQQVALDLSVVENESERALREIEMEQQAASVAAYNRGVENALRQRAELEREAFLATWMDGPDEGGNERG